MLERDSLIGGIQDGDSEDAVIHLECLAIHPAGIIGGEVSYCFSAYGSSLIPLIQALCVWGEQHLKRQGRSDLL